MTADILHERRLRRWSRGLLALALLALVGGVVTFRPAVHWIAERELSRVLDVRARIERLELSPFTGRLHATGISLREKAAGRPLLSLRGLDLEIVPSALWQRELLVTRLELEGPEAWVQFTSGGFSWLPGMMTASNAPPRLAITLGELRIRGGRVHVEDRRRTPAHREDVERLEVTARNLSMREDRREARSDLLLRGWWRGMTVSADGWVSPFASRRAFSLPVRIERADLGAAAQILPASLVPEGLTGEADIALDLRGTEGRGEWQVEAGVRAEARRVTARPRPDLSLEGGSLRIDGQGHWTPKVVGFSRLAVDVGGGRMRLGDRLQASADRLSVRGQADLDHRGLLVPEMAVDVIALGLGSAGEPPAVRVGRLTASGGTDQRAGTARLVAVSLADVAVHAAREADGSLDLARWIPQAGPGNGPLLSWEILQLRIEKAALDITDRTTNPERSLTVQDASLRLTGATSDPTQPIGFALQASTSLAPSVQVSGTWLRSPERLQLDGAVQDADLATLRGWLPASLPLAVSAGQASLAVQANLQRGQDGVAASGSVQGRVQSLRASAAGLESMVVENLEIDLGGVQGGGASLDSLLLEAQGRLRGRAVHVQLAAPVDAPGGEVSVQDLELAMGRMRVTPGDKGTRNLTIEGQGTLRNLTADLPGIGVESFRAQEVRGDVNPLTARLDPADARVTLAGTLSIVQAEGRSDAIPLRTWKAAGVQARVDELRTGPLALHVRELTLDRPDVEIVRAGSGAPLGAGGQGDTLATALRLDRLVVTDGRIGFRDETIRPAWTATLRQVEGQVEGLRTDTDAPTAVRLAAVEAGGARIRLSGRLRPKTWSGDLHAEVEDLDVLQPDPYLPDSVRRVVRGGTASGALDLSLRWEGEAFRGTGEGSVRFAPLELGDVERQLSFLLAEQVEVQVNQLSLDPLTVRLGAIRIVRPWMGVGRGMDGSLPALRLLNELHRSSRAAASPDETKASLAVGVVRLEDGVAEIEDKAVHPWFREQIQNLEVVVEDLTTQEDRKASVTLTGVLGDRSSVSLQGFILPLATTLYLDLQGTIHDFNLPRLNPYATRVTSYRLERGKLDSQIRYHIEANRLEGDNVIRIDQLALGEQVDPEDRFEALVGIPLALAVSLLQDASGEIILRVPVHGDLTHPTFDLGEALGSAIKHAVIQLLTAPFRLIGQIFTLGGRIGAIEIAPVLFAPGSWALDDAARAHLREVAAVMRERPKLKVKLSGASQVESDEDGLRAGKVEEQLRRMAREPGVKGRDDALDRLFLRTLDLPAGTLTCEETLVRLKAAQKVTRREVEDLPDARTLSIYDYLAGEEGIERDRMFLAEGKLYRTAEGGGDWARRVDFSILQP